tara:strand:+ start:267 stop:665 length:399 start_codon:yes stop_codon:yes gene_type:complete
MEVEMKTKIKKIPRQFTVGNKVKFKMKDFGDIFLLPNEQITFKTENLAEYDIARKDWGFYATPSLNGRLKNFGFKAVLIKNVKTKRYFIFLLEKNKEKEFYKYLNQEGLKIVLWLDNEKKLLELEKMIKDEN